jgi:hypothetical protein
MSGTISGVEFTQSGDDVNLSVFRGKTLRFSVIWGGATPIDISGYQASAGPQRCRRTHARSSYGQ